MNGFSLILSLCAILSLFWGTKMSSAQGSGWVSLKMGSISQGLAIQAGCQQETQGFTVNRCGFGEISFWLRVLGTENPLLSPC